jgi:2-polyprenyl-3-methyl-5-hydroxy-6-metoxy-1,4-benzoquinol methylase
MNFLRMVFKNSDRVCPASRSDSLDSWLRRKVHDPEKILHDYIKEGSIVMDIGCGPGFFSIPMAGMVGETGKVIAVDLQEEMLQKLKVKASKKNLQDRIIYHNCTADDIGINEKVDFVLTFWMVHEVRNTDNFFIQIAKTMKPGSHYMLVEPKLHVPLNRYNEIVSSAVKAGLKPFSNLKVGFSRGNVFMI